MSLLSAVRPATRLNSHSIAIICLLLATLTSVKLRLFNYQQAFAIERGRVRKGGMHVFCAVELTGKAPCAASAALAAYVASRGSW